MKGKTQNWIGAGSHILNIKLEQSGSKNALTSLVLLCYFPMLRVISTEALTNDFFNNLSMLRRTNQGEAMSTGCGILFRCSSKFDESFPRLVVKYLYGLTRASTFHNTESPFLSHSGTECSTTGQLLWLGPSTGSSASNRLSFIVTRNPLPLFLVSLKDYWAVCTSP